MTEINTNLLTEIEELKAILGLYDQAKKYLEDFDWCLSIKKCWHEKAHIVYEKIGVFLFQIEPLNNNVDDFIWVIVGDLPSVYLDKSVKTGKEVLETYCELMQEWVDNVKTNKSLEECYPVTVDPTIKDAELLSKRIAFIRRELLIPKQE